MIGPNLNSRAALVVIDVQKAIDHPSWGERNNPQAESNIAALLKEWRETGWPIYHIMSLANLDREYCTVVRTKEVLEAIGR